MLSTESCHWEEISSGPRWNRLLGGALKSVLCSGNHKETVGIFLCNGLLERIFVLYLIMYWGFKVMFYTMTKVCCVLLRKDNLSGLPRTKIIDSEEVFTVSLFFFDVLKNFLQTGQVIFLDKTIKRVNHPKWFAIHWVRSCGPNENGLCASPT